MPARDRNLLCDSFFIFATAESMTGIELLLSASGCTPRCEVSVYVCSVRSRAYQCVLVKVVYVRIAYV